MNDAEQREVCRQYVGCVSKRATCAILGIAPYTYDRCLRRNAAHVMALHKQADRLAMLYPLMFDLHHAPGDATTKVGHRLATLRAVACSPSVLDPATAPRGTQRDPTSAADIVDHGELDPRPSRVVPPKTRRGRAAADDAARQCATSEAPPLGGSGEGPGDV